MSLVCDLWINLLLPPELLMGRAKRWVEKRPPWGTKRLGCKQSLCYTPGWITWPLSLQLCGLMSWSGCGGGRRRLPGYGMFFSLMWWQWMTWPTCSGTPGPCLSSLLKIGPLLPSWKESSGASIMSQLHRLLGPNNKGHDPVGAGTGVWDRRMAGS